MAAHASLLFMSRNVLFLVCDDLRPWLGCYGLPCARTPHLDRLAAEGVTFTEAYTPTPLCSPARAALFTGQRPEAIGVRTLKDKLRGTVPDLTTWPQLLRARGWQTFRAGKVFHKGVPEGVAMRMAGDDDPLAWDRVAEPPGLELNANGTRVDLTPWATHQAGTGGALSWLEAEKEDHWHHDANVATAIVDFLRDAPTAPFVAAAGFARPHVPWVAPRRFFAAQALDEVPLNPDQRPYSPLPEAARGRFGAAFNLAAEDRRRAVRAYLATVSFVDEQVGRILDALEASGRRDETLIIFTADHGFQMGERGLWFKNFPYGPSAHLPLLISDPTRRHTWGRRSNAMVDLTDLFPTVTAWTDSIAANPTAVTGRSLLPQLDDPATPGRPGVRLEVWGASHAAAWRTPTWHYVRWDGDPPAEELFARADDSADEHNLLAATPDHPAVAELRAALDAPASA